MREGGRGLAACIDGGEADLYTSAPFVRTGRDGGRGQARAMYGRTWVWSGADIARRMGASGVCAGVAVSEGT